MKEDTFNILFVGDVVGKTGRNILKETFTKIKKNFNINFIIANIENVAHGSGITEKIYNELKSFNINCFTSGNHIWDKKEILKWIDTKTDILRPANYPPSAPGRGVAKFNIYGFEITVINLMGRVFMHPIDCPFRKLDELILKYKKPIIVDFHAEATSEKLAFGYYADGKVSAVIGTHTHIQTADNQILKNGTGYITDVGMTGGFDSIIGGEKENIIKRFLTGIPYKFEPSSKNPGMDAVIIKIDKESFLCKDIVRIQYRKEEKVSYLKWENTEGKYGKIYD